MVAQTLLGVAYVDYSLYKGSIVEAGRWLSGRTGRSFKGGTRIAGAVT